MRSRWGRVNEEETFDQIYQQAEKVGKMRSNLISYLEQNINRYESTKKLNKPNKPDRLNKLNEPEKPDKLKKPDKPDEPER